MMSDLRDHSQPCATCGRYSPEVDHWYLEPQATCVECGGAGGRGITIDYGAILAVYDPEWLNNRAGMAGVDWERLRIELEAAATGDTG